MEALVPISMFAVLFGIMYIYFTTRNKERLAMIEKGVDAKLFTSKRNRAGIKLGLLGIGVAIGILMGQLIVHSTSMDEEPAVMSMIFLFAGAGLVIEHFLARKEAQKNIN